MQKKTIVVTAVLALALAGIGAGAANASTSAPSNSSSVSTPTTASVTPPAADTEVPDATEAPGGATETVETPGVSDGNDGGHADPEGVDVNNEGGASEK